MSSKAMSVNSYSEEQQLNLPQSDYFNKSQQNLTSLLNNQNTQLRIQFQDSIYWQENSSTASTMDCNIKEEQALQGEQILVGANKLVVQLSTVTKLEFYFKIKHAPRLIKQLETRRGMTEQVQKKILQKNQQIRQFFTKNFKDPHFDRLCKKLKTVAQRLFDLSYEWEEIIYNYSEKLKDLQQNEGRQLARKTKTISLSLGKKVLQKQQKIYSPKSIVDKIKKLKTSIEEVKEQESNSIELLSPIKSRDEK